VKDLFDPLNPATWDQYFMSLLFFRHSCNLADNSSHAYKRLGTFR
jgi:hypothetical protein